jgi:hypothetical protein
MNGNTFLNSGKFRKKGGEFLSHLLGFLRFPENS